MKAGRRTIELPILRRRNLGGFGGGCATVGALCELEDVRGADEPCSGCILRFLRAGCCAFVPALMLGDAAVGLSCLRFFFAGAEVERSKAGGAAS